MTVRVMGMSEEESAAWLGLAQLIQVLPAALDSQLQRDSGLTHFEFTVLTVLAFAPERTLRMSVLAQATAATLPRLSHVCTRLARRGLVERTSCPDDGRATNITLSSQGKRTVARATPGHRDLVRRLVIEALSPEQLSDLTAITTVIAARLGDTAECQHAGTAEEG